MRKEFSELLAQITNLGVSKGDILYVASDIKGLMYLAMRQFEVRGKAATDEFLGEFVDALQELVGDEGTLLFPIYSNDFCAGRGFDIAKTIGYTGNLSNWILANRKDFSRTAHATHSLLVWGKNSSALLALQNQDAWGPLSPFEFLKEHGGKQLFFGIDAHLGFTFGHYIEQCADVPYRHLKYFIGDYTDKSGKTEKRMYSMNVRDMDVETWICTSSEFLVSKQVAQTGFWKDIELTVVDLPASYDVVYDDLKNNNGLNTVAFNNGYKLDWTKEKSVPYEVKVN